MEISYSLETLWKSIIRPPRDKYKFKDLGPKEFNTYGKNYVRKSYKLIGHREIYFNVHFMKMSNAVTI